jgi:DNA-binding transcriptional LysR family regulator
MIVSYDHERRRPVAVAPCGTLGASRVRWRPARRRRSLQDLRAMPKPADTLSIDLAALHMLRLVCNLQSFSKAAEALEVNQSTVSYTINRLRKIFRDPLFVRQGGGIVPTQRCLEIVPRVGQMLDEFEALSAPSQFVPSQASGAIVISCNYYERHLILPAFIREMRRLAPNVVIEVKTAAAQGVTLLKQGEADLLIGPAQVLESHLYHRALMEDYYVCLMDERHPLAGTTLSLDDYLRAGHAVVTYGNNWRSPYQLELERRSLTLNRRVSVPSLSDLPSLLRGSDLISTVPSRFADTFGRSIHVANCPVKAGFKIGLTWTHRTHHAVFHGWVRQLIATVCSQLPPLLEPHV